MTQPTIFISYSRVDEEWKDRLVKQLRVLQLEGAFDVWDDRRIQTGDDWYPEIEAAMESVGTTYFNDDAQIAKDLTKECIEKYEDLLKRCEKDVAQKEKIQRSMGLKIEQLKAECKLIDTAHDD